MDQYVAQPRQPLQATEQSGVDDPSPCERRQHFTVGGRNSQAASRQDVMTYVEDRFGSDVHGPFKGKVCDGIRFARDPRQTPQPFKIANDAAQVSKPSYHNGLADGHGVVSPALTA